MWTRIPCLIEDQGIVLMPGCYNAVSASIVQKTGFRAGSISGYALSASLLGKPDFGNREWQQLQGRCESYSTDTNICRCWIKRGQRGADACFVEAPRDDVVTMSSSILDGGQKGTECNMLEGGVTPLHII